MQASTFWRLRRLPAAGAWILLVCGAAWPVGTVFAAHGGIGASPPPSILLDHAAVPPSRPLGGTSAGTGTQASSTPPASASVAPAAALPAPRSAVEAVDATAAPASHTHTASADLPASAAGPLSAQSPKDDRQAERDSDGDGVIDRRDACRRSPPASGVDRLGCPARRGRLALVHFEEGSAELSRASRDTLAAAAATLRQHASLSATVAAHTDARGSAEDNLALAGRRAQAVIEHLVALGVSAGRLQPAAFGESSPVAGNTQAFDRARNRRVVIRVTESTRSVY